MKLLSTFIGSILTLTGGVFLLIAMAKAVANIWGMPLSQIMVLGITIYTLGKILELIGSENITEAKEVD